MSIQDISPDCCSLCTLENRACNYHASYGLHPSPPEGTNKPDPKPSPAGCTEGYAWQADRFTDKE